jgi:aspartate/methionine/tyrosine aminotransferase
MMFPGTSFGAGEGYLRVSFLQPIEAIRTAVERIRPVVRRLQGA